MKEELARRELLSDTPGGEHKFFVSDDASLVEDIAHYFMGEALDGRVEQVEI